MRTLIESSFGRKVVADYFERTTPYRVYVSENYRTAMVLTLEAWHRLPGQVRACSTTPRAKGWGAPCGR